MRDNIINELPEELQDKLHNLYILENDGWSKEWNDLALSILLDLNQLRDNAIITEEEWNYIRKRYLKSIGNISENNSDFLNFMLKSNR